MIAKIDFTRPLVQEQRPRETGLTCGSNGKEDFQAILRRELVTSEVQFTKHAQERLSSRKIALKKEEMEQLKEAVAKAGHKGAREVLVLLGDVALVVNVGNRKVITAMDRASLKGNVFTNIDSAVIVK